MPCAAFFHCTSQLQHLRKTPGGTCITCCTLVSNQQAAAAVLFVLKL
jgi:hypothetical protein